MTSKTTPRLSDTLNRLSESATLAMARMSRELAQKGHDVISLSLGEPDFDTPDFVKKAGQNAIAENYSHYAPVNGYGPLREAICHKFKRDNGLTYTPDQIVVSTGAKQSIANVVMALISTGEEVLLPAPYWVSYYEIVKMAGGIPVVIETSIENDFKITPEQLSVAITPKTRLMIYSSPCNPSGSVYTKDELAGLAKVVAANPELLVISDEIYELINFEGQNASLAAFEEVYDQVITINGVSKGFAMTGYRIGYIGAPLWIAKACNKMQGQTTSAPSGVSQMMAKAAVEADPSTVGYMKEAFLRRRKLMLDGLGKIDGLKINVPEGAFYVFPDVSSYFGKTDGQRTIKDANDFAMYLLETEMVATVSGTPFGSPNCLRISYAASDEKLQEALVRIERALGKLRMES